MQLKGFVGEYSERVLEEKDGFDTSGRRSTNELGDDELDDFEAKKPDTSLEACQVKD